MLKCPGRQPQGVSGIDVEVIAKRFKKLHELEPIAKSAAAGLDLGRSTWAARPAAAKWIVVPVVRISAPKRTTAPGAR
jgi:hypothetical protein